MMKACVIDADPADTSVMDAVVDSGSAPDPTPPTPDTGPGAPPLPRPAMASIRIAISTSTRASVTAVVASGGLRFEVECGSLERMSSSCIGRAFALCSAATAFVACGGEEPVADGGTVDSAADGGLVVLPPDIPWLDEGRPPIRLAPCPPGWREVLEETGFSTCDPYPEDGPADCENGEAHFPGEPGCLPIGDPCPSGDYATDLRTTGPVVYVNPAAPAGGDGSFAAPFGALSDVIWSALASGTTVALAKGTYEGVLPLKAGVHVVGACAADTRITGITAPVTAVVSITTSGEPAVVRNLTIADAPQVGVAVRDGRSATLEGVLIDGVTDTGILVNGGSEVTANSVVIEATRQESGQRGWGLLLDEGAQFEGSRLISRHNVEVGLAARRPGTSVRITDAVFAETQPRPTDRRFGRGVGVLVGARFEAERVFIFRNTDVGLDASGAGSTVVLTDTVVRESGFGASAGVPTHGIAIGSGATLEAARLLVSRNVDSALFSEGADTSVTLTDAVIRETTPRPADDGGGRGIQVGAGAQLEATRLLVTRNHEIGLLVDGAATSVTLVDAAIRETDAHEGAGDYGWGIGVQSGAVLRATRLVVAENVDLGVYAFDEETSVTLADGVVRDTQPHLRTGEFGLAISGQTGAVVSLERVQIDGAYETGLVALWGAVIDANDVTIERVERSSCDCPERGFGYAAAVIAGELRMSRFAIREAATCGLFVSSDSTGGVPSLDLESGLVESNPIGACVQVDGYDLMRLTRGVVFRDNETSLQSTMLPVPSPVDGIGL